MKLEAAFYTPLQACKAVGLARGTLDTWTHKGITKSFEGQSVMVGKARAFPTTDVLALALIKASHDIGAQSVELYSVAPRFARMFLETKGRWHQLHLRFYGEAGSDDSKVSCAPNDDVLSTPAAAGARVTITFDLTAIFGPVLKALEGLNPEI